MELGTSKLGVPSLRRDPRPAAGFTLIEMMVAIGIIMLAFGFMLPTLNSFTQDRKVSSAGSLIATTLNGARQDAVTQKRPFGVVFYRRGVRIYDFEGRKNEDGEVQHFVGGLVEYSRDDKIQYRLQFANKKYEELADPPATDDVLRPEDVVLRFKDDGTIDFGNYADVPSFMFQKDMPANADVVFDLSWDEDRKGWLDIRPQGRIVFKVAEVEGSDEEN
ncbi:MAG: Tfp pilus assembly protein FimT/FimU [Planctomycetota bacterium]